MKTPLTIVIVQLLSCAQLCDPVDCSTPGLPVICHLPELTQTHIQWVCDAKPNHLILCCPLIPLPSVIPASGSFLMSQIFATGGQSTGASASASVLPVNIQDFMVQLSHSYMTTWKSIALTIQTFDHGICQFSDWTSAKKHAVMQVGEVGTWAGSIHQELRSIGREESGWIWELLWRQNQQNLVTDQLD